MCARCYISCETCSGPGHDQCVACPRGWQLAAGECRPDCPEGFYKTEYGCQKCHYSCRNCLGKTLSKLHLSKAKLHNIFVDCKNQADKRRINVEAYLVSAQPVSTLQLVNPFNFVTGLAIIACLCIIVLFVTIFIILQVSLFESKECKLFINCFAEK